MGSPRSRSYPAAALARRFGVRGDEGGGVGDEFVKDDLRGAHHELIRTKCGILNPHGLPRRPDRLADERAVVTRRTVQGGEKPGERPRRSG